MGSEESKAETGQEDTTSFYHYTTKDGAQGIKDSGVIFGSTPGQGDAAFGPGSYFTTVEPSESKCDIATNNYDNDSANKGLMEDIVGTGRTDYYVKLDLPTNDVPRCDTDRDVYRYPDDLHITQDMNPVFGKTGN